MGIPSAELMNLHHAKMQNWKDPAAWAASAAAWSLIVGVPATTYKGFRLLTEDNETFFSDNSISEEVALGSAGALSLSFMLLVGILALRRQR